MPSGGFQEKQRRGYGLYQAETSRLKNLYCKFLYDSVLNNV
jgi:hypothetical protein